MFLGKCAKQTEQKSKAPKKPEKLESVKIERSVPQIVEVSEPGAEGVFALTTIKNFYCDSLNEYVFQSEWVFVTREKLMEPRFQQHLAKAEALSNLCKKMAEKSGNAKRTEVVAKPPACHCNDLKDEKVCETKVPKLNPFRRVLNAISNFWKRVCNKIKKCLCKTKDEPIVDLEDQDFDITNSYLCR